MDILIWFPFCYVSFNTQKVKIVIKKQVHIHLSFIDPKIKIFRDFRGFVLRPILKNENSEIAEILLKGHNTEMWECSFKSSWNAFQMTSNSKSFGHIANLVASIWVLKAFDSSGYITFDSLFVMSVLTLKKLKQWSKKRSIYLSFIDPQKKVFPWFPSFVLSSIPKNENSEITEILQKGHNLVETLFKWRKTQNHVSGCCLLRVSNSTHTDYAKNM